MCYRIKQDKMVRVGGLFSKGWSGKSLEEVKFEQRGLQTEEGIGTKVLRSNEYDTSKDQ